MTSLVQGRGGAFPIALRIGLANGYNKKGMRMFIYAVAFFAVLLR